MIWVAATLIAAVAQTARNAAQAGLGGRIGTIGATSVRFIFGFPFAALFLLLLTPFTDLPPLNAAAIGFTAMGAGAQIGATAFMLLTMRGQSFGVATALMKTEPVTLALIGILILNEPMGPVSLAAIGLATLGVMLSSGARWSRAGLIPVVNGITAGALFGLSAIGFRGALLTLPEGSFFVHALTILVLTLGLQSSITLAWMLIADRRALRGIMGEWRVSLAAGGLGAFASLFWFIGFALTPAANVRTLALIEVVFAQIVSGRFLHESTGRIQLIGMALIAAGVGWLLVLTATGG